MHRQGRLTRIDKTVETLTLGFQEGVKYKSVNTYSGWTSATRHKYQTVKVKMLKSGGKETLIERLPSQAESEEQTEKKDKEVKRCKNRQNSLNHFVPNLKYSPGQEHANTERQATGNDQEIISREAEQAQDARQHQEEVDQRGVRFSFFKINEE